MAISLHSLTRVEGSKKRRMRVGRGRASGKGKTAGKGHKGQMARAGHKRKPTFEGGQMRLIRRLPKRGFKSRNRQAFLPVNVGALQRFDSGTEVNVELLRKHGIVSGPGKVVKVLGTGDLSNKLVVKAHAFSGSARSKIEAAGGTCEVIK
jgi:large subunit ribosomal protein L15